MHAKQVFALCLIICFLIQTVSTGKDHLTLTRKQLEIWNEVYHDEMDKLKELCKDDEDKFLAMRDELSSKIASEDPAVISEIMNNVNMRLRNYNDQLGYESEGEIVFRGMNPVSPQKDDPYKKEKVSVASVIAELEKNPSEDELDKINEKLVQYINDLLHKIEKTEVHDNPTASVSADTAATDDDNLDKEDDAAFQEKKGVNVNSQDLIHEPVTEDNPQTNQQMAPVSAVTAAIDNTNLEKPVAAKNEQLNAPVKKKIRNKISSLFHVHKKDHNKE